jgi:hypothetical protein
MYVQIRRSYEQQQSCIHEHKSGRDVDVLPAVHYARDQESRDISDSSMQHWGTIP